MAEEYRVKASMVELLRKETKHHEERTAKNKQIVIEIAKIAKMKE